MNPVVSGGVQIPAVDFATAGETISQIEDVNQPANGQNASCFPENLFVLQGLQRFCEVASRGRAERPQKSPHNFRYAGFRLHQMALVTIDGEFWWAGGKNLIQLLSLLKVTMGRRASAYVGVVHEVNDPETLLRNFVFSKITDPALKQDGSFQNDPFLKTIGVRADSIAYQDIKNAPSPAAQIRIQKQREKAKKEQS